MVRKVEAVTQWMVAATFISFFIVLFLGERGLGSGYQYGSDMPQSKDP